jgi:hypothetical protein
METLPWTTYDFTITSLTAVGYLGIKPLDNGRLRGYSLTSLTGRERGYSLTSQGHEVEMANDIEMTERA